VIATIPAGETVDVGGCTGSWCAVNFNGRSGFASASYLQGGASVSGGVVAVAPGYVEEPYYDDYYDYGYSYGPSIGFYAGPRYRYGWRGGHWQGRPGGWAGRPGNWPISPRVGSAPTARPIPGTVSPRVGAAANVAPRVTAPVGMPRGGMTGGGGPRGSAAMGGGPRPGGGGVNRAGPERR